MQKHKSLLLSLLLMLGVGCGVNDPTASGPEDDEWIVDDQDFAPVDDQDGTAARIDQANEGADSHLQDDVVSAYCYENLITSTMNPYCWDLATICALAPSRC